MQRYNIFNQIHKGLRSMLYDTALTLQQTDFTKSEEAENSFQKVEQVLHAFHSHAENEDRYVLPFVGNVNAALIHEFESEHETDEKLGNKLSELIAIVRAVGNDSELTACGYALQLAFNEFTAFNLYHMNKEEVKINNVLWDNFSDDQIRSLEQEIVNGLPPSEKEAMGRWMLRGISNTEISNWLIAVKNSAPDFVFKNLLSAAEEELSPGRWYAVKEALTEGAMLA